MSENLYVPQTGNKEEIYRALLPQLEALLGNETDLIANLANAAAALHESFDHLWTGFYLVKGDELVLGPFQGPIACTRIRYGQGVCGTAWKSGETIIVPNVEQFPGHIACNSLSKSEIVIPLFSGNRIAGVLDIDSAQPNTFDETDKFYLEKVCEMIKDRCIL